MLETLLNIGQTLRESNTTVDFLPFVERGKVEEITKTVTKKNGETIKKVIQEKPHVEIYDVTINSDSWRIRHSDSPYDENHAPVFIKGNKDDRFYIAGDINGNYFGNEVNLESYFGKLDKDIEKKLSSETIIKFRAALRPVVKEIETAIKSFRSQNPNQKYFVQFRFTRGKEHFFWDSMSKEIEEIGEFIINNKYVEIVDDKLLLKRAPVSFFTQYNLNNLQHLDQNNSLKVISLTNIRSKGQAQLDPIKNLLVADKFIKNTTQYFGKVLVQILPAGQYSPKSLAEFLSTNSLWEQTEEEFENIEQRYSTDEVTESDVFEIFNKNKQINKFDILFLNRGSSHTTDITMYISSINRTEVDVVKERLKQAQKKSTEQYQQFISPSLSEKVRTVLEQELNSTTPFKATEKLLKQYGKDDEKLAKHHREILYKIFRDSYFEDPILLKNFNDKVEYGTRNNEDFKLNYLILLVNFIYMNNILINNQYLSMKDTQSYKTGKLLGSLARNIDREINSFSKQYAGNISRRVSTLEDLTKLLNFINEKLVIHEKLYTNVREQTAELINLINSFDEQYKKDYVIAGFFETYLMPFSKQEK